MLGILNKQLYEYLRTVQAEDISEAARKLGLLDKELKFLETLLPVALNSEKQGFENYLTEAKMSCGVVYPFEVFLCAPGDQSLTTSRLGEYLSGKRVVLVGPAKSTIGRSQGKEIESYDVVVRLNFQWPISSELVVDIGSRMDMLYHTCNGDLSVDSILIPELRDTRFICYERNIDSRKLREFSKSLKIEVLDITTVYQQLNDRFGSPFPTGIVAVEHLTKFPLKQLYITGLTLFQDGYHPGYPGEGAKNRNLGSGVVDRLWEHDVRAQAEYLKVKSGQDSRIKLDSVLIEILQ